MHGVVLVVVWLWFSGLGPNPWPIDQHSRASGAANSSTLPQLLGEGNCGVLLVWCGVLIDGWSPHNGFCMVFGRNALCAANQPVGAAGVVW
jgi:hypothetical protein